MTKKILYFLFILSMLQATRAQTPIHTLPTNDFFTEPPYNSYSNNSVSEYYTIFAEPTEGNVIARIDDLTDNVLGSNYAYTGDLSVYYARRVLAHIQMYYYFDRLQDARKANHLNDLEVYFNKLLLEQCIEDYPSDNNCSAASNPYHGGFPSFATNPLTGAANNDPTANPRPTSIALHAMLEVRNFYLNIGMQNMLISCEELEDRIRQAKDALYAYEEFNNQYLNLTAFAFIAASTHDDLYNDSDSECFLIEIGSELINGTHPLRPNSSQIWNYSGAWGRNWNEGQQADGSWKDYGRDRRIDEPSRNYKECEKWHDSEMDYHATMIEGLAKLYTSLQPGTLKNDTKEKLIKSINHIIDYNGVMNHIEHSFNSDVIRVTPGNPTALSQSRLDRSGRIGKYHRETSFSECSTAPFNITASLFNKKSVGIGLLRSLIIARNTLNLPTSEETTLNRIIKMITVGILNVQTVNNVQNNPFEQLYDLSLYLNRDHLNDKLSSPSYENDKLIVSFDDKIISSFHEDICNDLQNIEDFYKGNQSVQDMITGDFNGDGTDELIVAYKEAKGIYRFQENSDGDLEITERFYYGTQLTQALEVGDFDGDGTDELVIAFEDGLIYRYRENTPGSLSTNENFYSNGQITQALKAGDFDGDGTDELIIAFVDGGLIYRYREIIPGSLATNENFYSNGQTTQALESGDFNGDGTDELIIAFQNGGLIYRYKEHTPGSLSTNENFYSNGQTTQSLKAGDFNGDDTDELIIAFENGGLIYRYKENLAGNLVTSENFYSNGQITQALAVGDFDKDVNAIDELIISFSGNLIYRYAENTAGNLVTTEKIYDDGQATNKMAVLKKSLSTSGRTINTAESIQQFEKNIQIVAYPNPVTNYLKVSGLDTETDYILHSIDGRLISKGKIKNDRTLDFSNFKPGMYFLKIDSNTIFKIIKK